jgi:hypothetical protein
MASATKSLLRCGALMLSVLPTLALGQDTMAQFLIKDTVDQQLHCAAVIMALGEESDLSALVAGYFPMTASDTMVTLGGWDDKDAAQHSILLQAIAEAKDHQFGMQVPGARPALIERQAECVLSRLHNR